MPTLHRNILPADGIHVQHSFVFATATDMNDFELMTADDVGKVAYVQEAGGSFWDYRPGGWIPRGGGTSLAAHEAAANPHPNYATDLDLAAHTGNLTNPHGVTATQVLGMAWPSGPVAGKLLGVAAGPVLAYVDPPPAGRFRWTWANAAARLAQTLVSGDVGQQGWQTDLGRAYTCLALTGDVVWGEEEDRKWGHRRSSKWTNDAWEEGENYLSGFGTSVMGQSNVAPTTRAEAVKYGCLNSLGGGYFSVYTDGTRNGGNRYTYGIRYRGMILQRATGDGAAAGTWWVGACGSVPASVLTGPPANSFVVGRMNSSTNLIVRLADASSQVQDIDLGANFPGSLLGQGYDVEVYSLDGASFAYNVTRVNTGHCASGVISSGFRPATGAGAYGGFYLAGAQTYISLAYFSRWAYAAGAP